MLESWHQFKIVFVNEIGQIGGAEWVLFGQRHDGAVFWNNVSVHDSHLTEKSFYDAFWMRIGMVFDRFEESFAHCEASRKSFVPFKEVGVWFKDKMSGEWHFK